MSFKVELAPSLHSRDQSLGMGVLIDVINGSTLSELIMYFLVHYIRVNTS